MKKNKHGGHRENAGRPRKEETALLNLRVPKSLLEKINAKHGVKERNKLIIAYLELISM